MASDLAFRMREDGYLMQINQLRDEIDKLRRENERLHADQVHWELGNCPSCPNVVNLQEALEQNTKLRELVVTLWDYIQRPITQNWTLKESIAILDDAFDRMCELGIEVS